MNQETLAKIQPWRGEPTEQYGIPGFYRPSCIPITHTEQQFACQGVTRDESKEELVAVNKCHVVLFVGISWTLDSNNICILDAKLSCKT